MRLMRLPLLCIAALIGLGATAAAANAAISFSAPTASTTYGANVGVNYSVGPSPENDLRLEFTYTSGAGAAPGNRWVVLMSGAVATQSFSFPAANPASASQVQSITPQVGTTGSALPDGTYEVVLKYTDLDDGPQTSAVHAGVVIDTATISPEILTPVASSASSSPVSISFTLPEPALAGSVKLLFAAAGQTTRVVTLTSANEGAGTHSFLLDASNISTSANISSVTGGTVLPDGYWNFSVQYQDARGNPVAVSSPHLFRLDTITEDPSLVEPAIGSYQDTYVEVVYTLPETPWAGSVALTLTMGSANRAFPLSATTSGDHTETLDGRLLPAGTYSAMLSYRDALGNPIAHVTNSPVTLVAPIVPPPLKNPTGGGGGGDLPAGPGRGLAPPVTPTKPAPTGSKPHRLKARWSTRRTAKPGRWIVTATFKPVPGATTYKLSARNGRHRATGKCRTTGRPISCRLTATKRGSWKLQLSAHNRQGKTIAKAAKTVKVKR